MESALRELALAFIDSDLDADDFVAAVSALRDDPPTASVDADVADVILARVANMRFIRGIGGAITSDADPLIFPEHTDLHQKWMFDTNGLLSQDRREAVARVKEPLHHTGLKKHDGAPNAEENTHGFRIRKIASGSRDLKLFQEIYAVMKAKFNLVEEHVAAETKQHVIAKLRTFLSGSSMPDDCKTLVEAELKKIESDATFSMMTSHSW